MWLVPADYFRRPCLKHLILFLLFIKINQVSSQPVILSLSNFHRVKNEVKAQNAKAVCGISFKSWVACLPDVTFVAESHQNSLRDPFVARLLGFSSLLAQKNFDYAQDDIQNFCWDITFDFLNSKSGFYKKIIPHPYNTPPRGRRPCRNCAYLGRRLGFVDRRCWLPR